MVNIRRLPLFFIVGVLFVLACNKQEEKDVIPKVYNLKPVQITDTKAVLRANCNICKNKKTTLEFIWKKKSDSTLKKITLYPHDNINSYRLEDLEEDTEYIVNALLVIDSKDTLFGKDICFFTHGTMNDIDGNKYLTMRYDDKVWMTDNLRVTRYSDGTPLEARTGGMDMFEDGPVCYHNLNHTTYLITPNYGLLYNWAAAVRVEDCQTKNVFELRNVQGICPNGWHIPSANEWVKLFSLFRGFEMKTQNWGMDRMNTFNNYSQFSAEPAGFFHYDGNIDDTFNMVGTGAFFWSSSQYDDWTSVRYGLLSQFPDYNSHIMLKMVGYSVRCVKD
ncbi:MAG: fibrobacter succinogenes major paralogous domain-containing protein [Bacteroidales bacterium]|jgi:uncharacterized protein (TIGR02145 family)|nr:fibrobacter succinogenes major paralogous domain-containing protein [Bacteroidales bacterium]